MAEEQFNMMDDWFREAAEQDGPPAPAGAWEKMNTLLDAEEKKRRRFFFWWWLPILVGGAGFLFYQALRNPGGETTIAPGKNTVNAAATPVRTSAPDNRETATGIQQSTSTDPLPSKTATAKTNAEKTPGTRDHAPATTNHTTAIVQQERIEAGEPAGKVLPPPPPPPMPPTSATIRQPSAESIARGKTVRNNNRPNQQENILRQLPIGDSQEPLPIGDAQPINKNPTVAGTINRDQDTASGTGNAVAANIQEAGSLSASPHPDSTTKLQPETANNPLPEDTTTTKTGTPRQDNKKQPYYLYAGAAPEFSFTGGSKAGKTTLAWGGGIGFQPAKKLSIQAGFFVTKKIYSAPGNAYTPKPGSYYDNEHYKIKNVEADCSILEIPLQFRYDLLQQKKQSFFIMAGLTYTIMKEEYYSYDYTRYGQQAYSSYTYSTGSFKLFSGAGISFGYERKVGRSFFLVMAPYYNFPLRGVGEGSVKLNAAGILMGLRYQLPIPKK